MLLQVSVGEPQSVNDAGFTSKLAELAENRERQLKVGTSLFQLAAAHLKHPQKVERGRFRHAISTLSANPQGTLAQSLGSVSISVHVVDETEMGKVRDLVFYVSQSLGRSQPRLTPTDLLHPVEPLLEPVASHATQLAAKGRSSIIGRCVLGTPCL